MNISNKVLTFFGSRPNTPVMTDKKDVQKQGIIEKVNNIWANHRGKIILIGALAAIIGIKFGVESYSNQKTFIETPQEKLGKAWSDYWNSNCDPKKSRFDNVRDPLKKNLDIQPIDSEKGLDKKYNSTECAEIKQNFKDAWINYWDSRCEMYGKPPLTDGKRSPKCEYYRKGKEPFYEVIRKIEDKLLGIKLSDQEKCHARIVHMGPEYLKNFNNCMKEFLKKEDNLNKKKFSSQNNSSLYGPVPDGGPSWRLFRGVQGPFFNYLNKRV